MAASKNNITAFKDVSLAWNLLSAVNVNLTFVFTNQLVKEFVRKRTEVVIKINKITKSMPSNDMKLYKTTE